MKPCISQAATMRCSFSEDVCNFAKAGWKGMEVWLTKLENHLETHSLAETRTLIADQGITLAAASYQGGLLLSQGQQRQAHYYHFRKRLDLCQQLNVGTLLVAADFASHVDQGALERSVLSLKQAAQWAAAFGVRLALEFRGNAAFCSNLATAWSLVAECDEPNVGINLDVFHYYTGPSKLEDINLLTTHRFEFVQVCDVAGVPRELATDADRVLPGDGDYDLEAIILRLGEAGYDGWVSLELMNPTLWQADPVSVASVGLSAMERLLAAGARDRS